MPTHQLEQNIIPSGVLVHLPEPEPPQVVDRPPTRPPVGEEFLPGWMACDYSLILGDWDGEEYAYEVWVMPSSGGHY